jgi:hypothetical protein
LPDISLRQNDKKNGPDRVIDATLTTSPYADAKPDLTRPALPSPPPRETTATGAIYEHRKEHPSYESQVGEARPSIFDKPKSWMR